MPNDRAGAGGFLPSVPSPITSDPVLTALDQAGVTVPLPSKTASNNMGSWIVNLTPDEERTMQTLTGNLMQERVSATISQPGWGAASPDDQARFLQRQVTLARGQAEHQTISQIGQAQPERMAKGAISRIPIEIKPKVPVPVPSR